LVENISISNTASPNSKKDEKKTSKGRKKDERRSSKEWKDLEIAAMAAFQTLREDESWIKVTKNLTPEEWVKETNIRLQGRDVESLQLLLLALPLKLYK
jgi:hypothetical protein